MSHWDPTWRPYVPVAQRRRNAKRHADTLARQGHTLSPISIQGRTIARTFWGKAWCKHFESLGDYANRLPRGRRYVRNGSVFDLHINPGRVDALVSGSEVYTIQIDFTPPTDAHWRTIVDTCAGHIDSLLDLLQGRLDDRVMHVLCQPDTGLFPQPDDLVMRCSCPDWASLCKHLAAVLYGVGARLDDDPSLLFTLRQVDAQELIAHADINTLLTPVDHDDTLHADDLGSLFGIELDDEVSLAHASPDQHPPTTITSAALRQQGIPRKTIDRWLRTGVLKRTETRALYQTTEHTADALQRYVAQHATLTIDDADPQRPDDERAARLTACLHTHADLVHLLPPELVAQTLILLIAAHLPLETTHTLTRLDPHGLQDPPPSQLPTHIAHDLQHLQALPLTIFPDALTALHALPLPTRCALLADLNPLDLPLAWTLDVNLYHGRHVTNDPILHLLDPISLSDWDPDDHPASILTLTLRDPLRRAPHLLIPTAPEQLDDALAQLFTHARQLDLLDHHPIIVIDTPELFTQTTIDTLETQHWLQRVAIDDDDARLIIEHTIHTDLEPDSSWRFGDLFEVVDDETHLRWLFSFSFDMLSRDDIGDRDARDAEYRDLTKQLNALKQRHFRTEKDADRAFLKIAQSAQFHDADASFSKDATQQWTCTQFQVLERDELTTEETVAHLNMILVTNDTGALTCDQLTACYEEHLQNNPSAPPLIAPKYLLDTHAKRASALLVQALQQTLEPPTPHASP